MYKHENVLLAKINRLDNCYNKRVAIEHFVNHNRIISFINFLRSFEILMKNSMKKMGIFYDAFGLIQLNTQRLALNRMLFIDCVEFN